MIKPCNCQHSWQDEKYGNGNRVHNLRQGKTDKREVRCTVCLSVKDLSGGKK